MQMKEESVTKEQTSCSVGDQSSNDSYGTATPHGGRKTGCVKFESFLHLVTKLHLIK